MYFEWRIFLTELEFAQRLQELKLLGWSEDGIRKFYSDELNRNQFWIHLKEIKLPEWPNDDWFRKFYEVHLTSNEFFNHLLSKPEFAMGILIGCFFVVLIFLTTLKNVVESKGSNADNTSIAKTLDSNLSEQEINEVRDLNDLMAKEVSFEATADKHNQNLLIHEKEHNTVSSSKILAKSKIQSVDLLRSQHLGKIKTYIDNVVNLMEALIDTKDKDRILKYFKGVFKETSVDTDKTFIHIILLAMILFDSFSSLIKMLYTERTLMQIPLRFLSKETFLDRSSNIRSKLLVKK